MTAKYLLFIISNLSGHTQITFVRTCFDDKPSLDFDEMTGLWPNGWVVTKWLVFDEMAGLWPNDCIIFVFYYIFLVFTSNLTTFVKKVFELDVLFKLLWNYSFWPDDFQNINLLL